VRRLGPEHPDTLTSMLDVTHTLAARGDLEGAQRLQERVVEASSRLLGPEHPSTLAAVEHLRAIKFCHELRA